MKMAVAVLVACCVGCGSSAGGAGGAGGGSGGSGGSGGAGGSGGSGGGAGVDGAAEDLDMQASDFECILRWQKVRSFRITNKLGHMTEALAVANTPGGGGKYPVGTIIQLIPNEASVKRRVGFNTQTDDWEFFSLSTSAQGTTISKRGTTDVTNAFGGNCFGCHNKAAPQWDLLCETGHGCDPLPLSDSQLQSIQNSDPRCP